LTFNLDGHLVPAPAAAEGTLSFLQLGFKFGAVAQNPPMNGGVINLNAALCDHFFKVT
jgi:hypothetical protein